MESHSDTRDVNALYLQRSANGREMEGSEIAAWWPKASTRASVLNLDLRPIVVSNICRNFKPIKSPIRTLSDIASIVNLNRSLINAKAAQSFRGRSRCQSLLPLKPRPSMLAKTWLQLALPAEACIDLRPIFAKQ